MWPVSLPAISSAFDNAELVQNLKDTEKSFGSSIQTA
jgi:hypothetical protein